MECQEKLHSIILITNECVNAYSDWVKRLARLLNVTNVVQMHEVKLIWLKGLRRYLFLAELTTKGQKFEECVKMAEDQEGQNADRVGTDDLIRQMQELRCDVPRMSMQRRTDDSLSRGCCPQHFRGQQLVDMCDADDDEYVANIQAGVQWQNPGTASWNGGMMNGPAMGWQNLNMSWQSSNGSWPAAWLGNWRGMRRGCHPDVGILITSSMLVRSPPARYVDKKGMHGMKRCPYNMLAV